MLKYTRAALWKTLVDMKRSANVVSIIFYILSIAYPVYSIFMGNGYLAVNIVLAALTLSYFIFYLVTYGRNTRENKEVKSRAKAVYKWCKRGISLLTLGITVYSIYFVAGDPSFHSLLFTAFMVVFWVLDAVSAFVVSFIEKRIDFFADAIAMDTEGVQKVGNFFKRVAGDEVVESEVSEKTRISLERLSTAHSEVLKEKEKRRAEEKRERRERRRAVWRDRLTFWKPKAKATDVDDTDEVELAKK